MQLKSLAIPPFADFTPNALVIHGEPTIDELEGVGKSLNLMDNCSAWWRGDALLMAERLYGEDAFQIVPEGDESSWKKSRWVARCFPVERRREYLTFSHHEIVARLDEADQDYWLNRAEDESLSVSELRQLVRGEEVERVSWRDKFELLANIVQSVADECSDDAAAERLRNALRNAEG